MLQRGRAQLGAGLDALAIESFRGEIRVNPDSVDAYNGLAVAYGRIGRSDLAQRYFEMALAKDPASEKVQANLAKLIGTDKFAVRQVITIPAAEPVAPVALTLPADDLGARALSQDFILPAVATLELAPKPEINVVPVEILEKRGVLSTRFAAASAGSAVAHAAVAKLPAMPIEGPARAPEAPLPTLPAYYVQPEQRSARLERVSLNEVHLITRPRAPEPRLASARSFDSFGDRLATWLPKSISAEQSDNARRAAKNPVLMAAIERAENDRKLALAVKKVAQDLPEFAYVFFEDDSELVGA